MANGVPFMNEPIFWSVVDDMRKAGYDLPWYWLVKPDGIIGTVNSMSTGLHWTASWVLGERAGMAVMNPNDAVKIVNPT